MIISSETKKIIHRLESIAATGIGRRDFSKLHTEGNLAHAAAGIIDSTGTIIVTTGFPLPGREETENDGPPGAAVLAYVLINMGRSVEIVTDRYSRKAVCIALDALEIKLPVIVIDKQMPQSDDRLMALSAGSYGVFIAIERPGLAPDGKMYDMQGKALHEDVPQFDGLLAKFLDSGRLSVAIGDGGNELGMGGLLRQTVCAEIPFGDRIGADMAAQYQILCGVSNWGGWALAGALSYIVGKNLMCSPSQVKVMMQSLFAQGICDGYANARGDAKSVDGIPFSEHDKIYERIYSSMIFKG